MLSSNLSIIQRRWPDLAEWLGQYQPASFQTRKETPFTTLIIDNIHLGSSYDPDAEARLQASQIPVESQIAWSYGIGTGHLAKELCTRKTLKKIKIVILNPRIALASLSRFDHSFWLNDSRVTLLDGADTNFGGPLAAIPAELQLADESSSRLRDLVATELETAYISSKHGAANPEVIKQIKRNEELIKVDGDVASLFDSQPGQRIVVAAAGPSLGKHIDWLREHRSDVTLLAVNSALRPLSAADLTADIAMTIDPEEKIISSFEGYSLAPYSKVPMIYFPRVSPSVLRLWPGPRLTAYAKHPSYADIAHKYPRGTLFSSGSVLHPAVDLAVRMGATEVLLFGADLAFPNEQRYTQGAGWGEQTAQAKSHWVLNGHGEKVSTTASFRGYLRDLEAYIERHPQVRFINCCRDGAYIRGTHYLEEAQ